MSDRRWGCYYVRCPFCGRAAPLVEGFEDGVRIVWVESREDGPVRSALICRRCLLCRSQVRRRHALGRSDLQERFRNVEQAGGVCG